MVSEFAVRNSDAGSWGICGQGSPPSPGRRRPRHRHRHGGAGAGAGSVPAVYLDAVPASVLPHDAAAVAYDTIVRFLRLGLRTILMLALVVAAGGVPHRRVGHRGTHPPGPGRRDRLAAGQRRARRPAHQAGRGLVGANKRALRIGAVTLACLALVFWGRPTGKIVLGLTLALLVVLALIEFLGRPADRRWRPRPASHDAGQTVHDHLEGQDGQPE